MKRKIKYILLTLLFMPVYCNAKVRYTDYYLFKKDSESYYEESDLLKREDVYYYLNYNYEIGEEHYYLLDENPENLPLLDKEYSIINKIKSEKYSSELEGPFSTHYIDHNLSVKYIKFNNFNTFETSIENINIYSGDDIVFYYIYDKNFYYKKTINKESQIIIDLRDFYYIENLNITIKFKTLDLDNIEFDIELSNDLINYHAYHNKPPRSNLLEQHKINFIVGETPNENILTNYFFKEELLYKYYNLKRVDSNLYTQKPLINYEQDLSKYRKKYNYYKRDKVEIADEVKNIDDLLIKFSSQAILNISNLDLFKNGNQNIEICLINNICFNENILINIPKEKSKKDKKLKSNNVLTLENPIKDKKPELLNIPKEIIIKKAKDNYYNIFIYLLFSISVIMLIFLLIIRKRTRINVETV